MYFLPIVLYVFAALAIGGSFEMFRNDGATLLAALLGALGVGVAAIAGEILAKRKNMRKRLW